MRVRQTDKRTLKVSEGILKYPTTQVSCILHRRLLHDHGREIVAPFLPSIVCYKNVGIAVEFPLYFPHLNIDFNRHTTVAGEV